MGAVCIIGQHSANLVWLVAFWQLFINDNKTVLPGCPCVKRQGRVSHYAQSCLLLLPARVFCLHHGIYWLMGRAGFKHWSNKYIPTDTYPLCRLLQTPSRLHSTRTAPELAVTSLSRMVSFLSAGATLQPPAQCWLVSEFMPGGTLSQWLYGANADPRCTASRPENHLYTYAPERASALWPSCLRAAVLCFGSLDSGSPQPDLHALR